MKVAPSTIFVLCLTAFLTPPQTCLYFCLVVLTTWLLDGLGAVDDGFMVRVPSTICVFSDNTRFVREKENWL